MQLPTDFITVAYLLSFTGMALAVLLLVQFTKLIILPAFFAGRQIPDAVLQFYAFAWALIFVTVMYWDHGDFNVGAQGLVILLLLILVNAIVVTIAAMGLYDMFVKPKNALIAQLKNPPSKT